MNINNVASKENSDNFDSIIDAKNRIVAYLHARIDELTNAIAGQRPDENGEYPEDYYKDKDRRDQLSRFVSIVLNNKNFESLDSFLQSICQEIQNFPEESFEQLFNFIEQTFSIQIKPLTGPSTFYISWLNHWAERYGVAPDEIEKIMPFEDFQKFEQQNDSAARIKIVMNKLGKQKE